MSRIDLSKYGICGTKEVIYNPSYDLLFKEETKESLDDTIETDLFNLIDSMYEERNDD